MDELSFAESFVPQGPPTLQTIFAKAMTADREDLEEARRAREDQAAREERRENLAMLNRLAGDPIGEVNRCQMAVASARDEVNDLRSRLADAEARLHRAAGALVDFQAEADQVMTASARRSQTPDMLAEAKRVAAELKVDAMLAARSAHPQPARPPFGVAARSETRCPRCQLPHKRYGVTEAECFLICADPHPPEAPEVPGKDELDWLKGREDQAGAETGRYQRVRAGGRDYVYDKDHREISRCL